MSEEAKVENIEEKKKISKKKKALIISSCVFSMFLVLFIVAYFVAGNYFFDFALGASFNQLEAVDQETIEKLEQMPLPENNVEWLFDVNISIANIYSEDDGNKLNAFLITQKNYSNKWVITIHGYKGQAVDNASYAKEFYDKGFNVMLPDLEGHGFSEGQHIGMGYTDKFDVLGWINYLIEKDPECQIVLHGVSMGGATVMMTTGEKLPSNVKCAIEDCGYTNVNDVFKHVAGEYLNLPFKNTLLNSLNFFVKKRLGISLSQADSVAALKKSTTPTLFIHGSKDNFVPFKMLDIVYNANPNLEKEKLVVEGANHAYSSTYNPELYFGKVFEFVNKYVI